MESQGPTPRELDQLLEQMIVGQRAKVLAAGRAKVPNLTHDDCQTPEAWPELYADAPFNYEDGILNGLLSAQIAIRALARELRDPAGRKLAGPQGQG